MKDTPITYNVRPVITELNKRRALKGSDAAVARDLNISASLITMIRNGKRLPSATILKALGMEAIVNYHEAKRD